MSLVFCYFNDEVQSTLKSKCTFMNHRRSCRRNSDDRKLSASASRRTSTTSFQNGFQAADSSNNANAIESAAIVNTMTVEAQIEDIPTSNTDNAFTVESHVNVTFTEEMNGVLSHNEVEMDTDVIATRNGLDRDVFLNGTVDKKSSHDFNEINSCSETNNIATSKL